MGPEARLAAELVAPLVSDMEAIPAACKDHRVGKGAKTFGMGTPYIQLISCGFLLGIYPLKDFLHNWVLGGASHDGRFSG